MSSKSENSKRGVFRAMKKGGGNATFKGPEVNERKKFAPATRVEAPKKGKGSYDRKKPNEDEEQYGEVPMKPAHFNNKKPEKDKFPPRKSAQEAGQNPTRRTAAAAGQNPTRRTAAEITTEDNEEKNCWNGYKKQGTKMKGGEEVNNCVKVNNESANIIKFIDSVMVKNYASADKYLKSLVLDKIQEKIQKEINKPLF